MKKIKLTFLFLIPCLFIFAQESPYLGAHFAYNSTWLMNKQVFDHGSEMDPVATFGGYFGFIAGYKFNEDVSLELNFNFNNINQKYEGILSQNRYTAETNIKALDIPLLGKFGSKTYFEIGPVLQILNSATYSRKFGTEGVASYKHMLYPCTNYDADVLYDPNTALGPDDRYYGSEENLFKKTNFALALGFGTAIDILPEQLVMNFGFRFQYTFTDMRGVNGLGETKDSDFVPDEWHEKDTFHNNALLGGFRLGIIYYFM